MKPEHLEDQTDQLVVEASKALNDAAMLVHCKTGQPIAHVLVSILGAAAGETARLLGCDEASVQCSKLATQLQVLGQPNVAEIAKAAPMGRA